MIVKCPHCEGDIEVVVGGGGGSNRDYREAMVRNDAFGEAPDFGADDMPNEDELAEALLKIAELDKGNENDKSR